MFVLSSLVCLFCRFTEKLPRNISQIICILRLIDFNVFRGHLTDFLTVEPLCGFVEGVIRNQLFDKDVLFLAG